MFGSFNASYVIQFGFGGFYSTVKQYKAYSTKDTFENVEGEGEIHT